MRYDDKDLKTMKTRDINEGKKYATELSGMKHVKVKLPQVSRVRHLIAFLNTDTRQISLFREYLCKWDGCSDYADAQSCIR